MMNPKYLEIYKSNNVYPQVNNTFPNFEIYNLREPILSNNERVVNKDTPLKAPAERKKGKSRLLDLPSFSSFVKAYANKHGIAYKEAIKSQEVKEAYRAFRGSNNLEVSVLNPNPMNLKLAYPKEASNAFLDKRFNAQPQLAPVNFGSSDAFLQRTSVKFQAYENLKNATKEIATDFINNLTAADEQEVNKFKGSINKILPLSEEMQAKLFKEIDASNKGIFAYSVFPDLIAKFNFEEFSDKQNRPLIYAPLSNRSSIISRKYLDGVDVQIVNIIPNLEKVDSVYFNFGGLFNENFNKLLSLYDKNISRPFKFYFVDSRKIDNLQDLYRTMPQNVLDYLITVIAGIADPQDFSEIKKYLRTGKDVDLTIQAPPTNIVRTNVPQAPNLPPGIVKQEPASTVTTRDNLETQLQRVRLRPVPVAVATKVEGADPEKLKELEDELSGLVTMRDIFVNDDISKKLIPFQLVKNAKKYRFKQGNIMAVQTGQEIKIYEVDVDQDKAQAKNNEVSVYEDEKSYSRLTYETEPFKVVIPPNLSSEAPIQKISLDDIQNVKISNKVRNQYLSQLPNIVEKYSYQDEKEMIKKKVEEIEALKAAGEVKGETKGEGFKGGALDTALLEFNAKVGIASIENLGKSGNDYVYRLNIN